MKRILIAGLVIYTLLGGIVLAEEVHAIPSIFTSGARILFQGDSITDGNRGRSSDPNHILGHGYQFSIAARYGALVPERKLIFINRGESGHKVGDLAGRWKPDALDLKPAVLSILIGVNDYGFSAKNPKGAEEYEKAYDALLASTIAALPNVRLVLGEPFIEPVGGFAEDFASKSAEIAKYQAAVNRLGKKYKAPVVHYQKMFDAAARRAPAEYWIWDGVHPTYAGHGLMAEEWIRTVERFYGKTELH